HINEINELEISGMLYGLGLQGKLDTINHTFIYNIDTTTYQLLTITSIISICISKRSTCDPLLTKYLKNIIFSKPSYSLKYACCIGLSFLFYKSYNKSIFNILIKECNRYGCYYSDMYNKGNKIWYDEYYRVGIGLAMSLVFMREDLEGGGGGGGVDLDTSNNKNNSNNRDLDNSNNKNNSNNRDLDNSNIKDISNKDNRDLDNSNNKDLDTSNNNTNTYTYTNNTYTNTTNTNNTYTNNPYTNNPYTNTSTPTSTSHTTTFFNYFTLKNNISFIPLKDSLCELLVNGLIFFKSKKKKIINYLKRSDNSKLQEIFYSSFFCKGICFNEEEEDILREVESIYMFSCSDVEMYRISGLLLYIGIKVWSKIGSGGSDVGGGGSGEGRDKGRDKYRDSRYYSNNKDCSNKGNSNKDSNSNKDNRYNTNNPYTNTPYTNNSYTNTPYTNPYTNNNTNNTTYTTNIKNRLIAICLFAEERVKKNNIYKILLDSSLLSLVIILNGTLDLEVLRILRRILKKLERSKYLNEISDFNIYENGCGYEVQYGLRYGDIVKYKMLLGILCCGMGMYRMRFSCFGVFCVICSFYVLFPVSVCEQEYFQMYRYFIVMCFEQRYYMSGRECGRECGECGNSNRDKGYISNKDYSNKDYSNKDKDSSKDKGYISSRDKDSNKDYNISTRDKEINNTINNHTNTNTNTNTNANTNANTNINTNNIQDNNNLTTDPFSLHFNTFNINFSDIDGLNNNNDNFIEDYLNESLCDLEEEEFNFNENMKGEEEIEIYENRSVFRNIKGNDRYSSGSKVEICEFSKSGDRDGGDSISRDSISRDSISRDNNKDNTNKSNTNNNTIPNKHTTVNTFDYKQLLVVKNGFYLLKSVLVESSKGFLKDFLRLESYKKKIVLDILSNYYEENGQMYYSMEIEILKELMCYTLCRDIVVGI
ncbi:hypothetical protein CWI36_1885p0010, partial [Hamiltosporidium magnivora]